MELTIVQLAALIQAEMRQPGEPWVGDRTGAEECCDVGLLEAVHRLEVDASSHDNVVYVLTPAGRAALAGRGVVN